MGLVLLLFLLFLGLLPDSPFAVGFGGSVGSGDVIDEVDVNWEV